MEAVLLCICKVRIRLQISPLSICLAETNLAKRENHREKCKQPLVTRHNFKYIFSTYFNKNM